MIIYGWRKRAHDRGECVGANCQTCGTKVLLHFVIIRNWLTLFFIPLIPLRAKRHLICPVCHTKYPVAKHHVDATEDMIGVTAAWRAHEMGDSDYNTRVAAYWALTATGPVIGMRQLTSPGSDPSDPSQLPPPPPHS